MKSTTIQYSLSTPTVNTVIQKPSINIKGVTSVRFVLSGFEDIFNPAVKLEVLWGDTTAKTNFFRPLAYNYKTQSILNEVIYGELAGTLFAHYDHVFSNNTTSYNYPLTSQFLITFKNGKTVYIYQPLNIFKGSYYDDIANLDILNTQITPTSSNNTIINFEGSNDQTYISVLRSGTSLTFDNTNYNSTCIPLCSINSDSVWVGLGSNNNWSTGSNWAIGRAPLSSTKISFGSSPRLAPFNNLSVGIPYNGINFNYDAGVYTIFGNSFTLYSRGIINNSTNLQTISNNISISGTGGIPINCSAGDITLTGSVTGTNSIVKTGPGALTFTGVNSYTGTTTISTGKLLYVRTNTTNDYASAAAYTIASGAILEINASAVQGRFAASNNSITGAGTFIKSGVGRASLTAGTSTMPFDMSAGASVDIQAGILDGSAKSTNLASLTLAAGTEFAINGTDSNLTLQFDVVNGTGGSIYIESGDARTLQIGANGGSGTYSGVITGLITVVKIGSGAQTFAGANTYTGSTSITTGTLVSVKGIATASFTNATLTVVFSTAPSIGSTYRFFPGSTVQSYASVTLIGAPGRSGAYTSANSTLTIS